MLAASCCGLPLFSVRAAPSAAPSTAFDSCALHDIGAAGVDGEADEDQEHREEHGHVEEREAPFVRSAFSVWSCPFRL